MPGQLAPLAIHFSSPQPYERILVSVAGVPEGARLNAGVDTGGGYWLVAPKKLTGLAINLPAGSPDTVTLETQLLDSNTRTPLSAKGTFSVRLLQPAGGGVSYAQAIPMRPPTLRPRASLSSLWRYAAATIHDANPNVDAVQCVRQTKRGFLRCGVCDRGCGPGVHAGDFARIWPKPGLTSAPHFDPGLAIAAGCSPGFSAAGSGLSSTGPTAPPGAAARGGGADLRGQ